MAMRGVLLRVLEAAALEDGQHTSPRVSLPQEFSEYQRDEHAEVEKNSDILSNCIVCTLDPGWGTRPQTTEI